MNNEHPQTLNNNASIAVIIVSAVLFIACIVNIQDDNYDSLSK